MSKFDVFITNLLCPKTGICNGCYNKLGFISMDDYNEGFDYRCEECSIIERAERQQRYLKREKEKQTKLKQAKKVLGIK